MEFILTAVFFVTVTGTVCAVVLCTASKLMYVKVDERLAKMEECLPGTNCGACGFPGCSGYAKALLSEKNVKTNLCTPGGEGVLKQISEILNVETGGIEKKIAVVRCKGSQGAVQKKMEYKGLASCKAAKHLFSGEGACAMNCLGYGDCQAVCPINAICIDKGLARINASCTGCGLCVKICPSNLITIESASIKTVVLCSNIEKGSIARKKCSNACIACGKCVRECPSTAIVMKDNLAVIDYGKCTGCGHCVKICVTHCIQPSLTSKLPR